MTDARQTHREAQEFFRWLTDQHHSNYGENDYIVLRGMGEPGQPGFHFVFREHLVVDGGTGQHQNALRRVIGEDQQVGKRALLGTEHWLVIGPAHDGQRRALPFTTSTATNCEIKADDGWTYNDSRAVPAALLGRSVASKSYVADGHRLIVALSDGCLTGTIECPGLDDCHARGVENHDICCLQQAFDDVGLYEFCEWQDPPYRASTLPAEIEWRWDGYGEDSEVWWRPVERAR